MLKREEALLSNSVDQNVSIIQIVALVLKMKYFFSQMFTDVCEPLRMRFMDLGMHAGAICFWNSKMDPANSATALGLGRSSLLDPPPSQACISTSKKHSTPSPFMAAPLISPLSPSSIVSESVSTIRVAYSCNGLLLCYIRHFFG